MTKLINKIIDICNLHAGKAIASLNMSSASIADTQYHLGRKHTALDIKDDILSLEIKDECEEFLEKLKTYIEREINTYEIGHDDFCICHLNAYGNIMEKIEHFQTERKDEK